jgi:hypothetical protein
MERIRTPVADMGAYEFQALQQQVIFVDADATGANDGTSWYDAFMRLQDALTWAAAFEDRYICEGTITEIWVAAGIYRPDEGAKITPGDRVATFQLLNGVALYGGFAGDETELSQRNVKANPTLLSGELAEDDVRAEFPDGPSFAENSYHVVTGSGVEATSVLDGFTITGGNANTESSVESGSGFNYFDKGSGMYNLHGSPTVRHCTFIENAAYLESGSGGGMYSELFNVVVDLTVMDFVFIRNAAAVGGGMTNDGGTPEVTRCTFFGNQAEIWGGGMYDYTSSSTTSHCIFSGNTAGSDGGGMLINGNYGGTDPTVTHCTFSGNMADISGGAFQFLDSGYNPTIINCIFWGNLPPLTDEGPPPTIHYSIVEGGWSDPCAVGVLNADPLFVDSNGADNIVGTEDDNLRLQAGSPCIDAGDNSSVPTGIATDLDGRLRFVDDLLTADTGSGGPPTVDMGAYEYACTANLDETASVTLPDFALFSQQWLQTDCGLCGGADFTGDNNVTFGDPLVLTSNWLCGIGP